MSQSFPTSTRKPAALFGREAENSPMPPPPFQPIHVIAPTRIDLAGGTLDIWPLYLYLDNPVTINVAISLYTHVKIKPRSDTRIVLISKDQREKVEFASLKKLHHTHKLGLISRVLSFFSPETGLTIETHSEVPSGAGLAGSSTLNIALCYALNRFTGRDLSKKKMQLLAKNIEACVINVPTGDQDYYPALYGKFNSLILGPEGVKRKSLTTDYSGFQKRALLIYSGTSRNSGINNWEIFKRVIDGDTEILEKLNNVSRVASHMKAALLAKDMDLVGTLLNEEWKTRKTLETTV
ncbi:MAG: hypothetical protein ACE5FU_06490, partial [Nitrospinota bacterium]